MARERLLARYLSRVIAIAGPKAAWSWLNDERDLALADEAVEAVDADLLPAERALVVVVHLA